VEYVDGWKEVINVFFIAAWFDGVMETFTEADFVVGVSREEAVDMIHALDGKVLSIEDGRMVLV
jgi:hypothetical protein